VCELGTRARDEGRCHYDNGYQECVATSDADCSHSKGCKKDGRCKFQPVCPA
jgi:hypothetical protein